MSSNKEIKKGALISYITIFFNIVAGILYTPWMIKEIGQADYGLYTLAISFIGFFTIDFGLGSAIARYLSIYIAEKDEESIDNFLGIIFKLFILLSLILLIALTIIYFFIDGIFIELSPLEIEKFKVIFVIIGLFSIVLFSFRPFDGILIANEKFFQLKGINLIEKLITIGLMVIFLFLGYKLYALVLINSLTTLLKVIYKSYIVKRDTNIKINFNYRDRKLINDIFNFSIWVTIMTVMQRFTLSISPTLLGIFSGSIEISIFSLAMTIEGYTYTLSNALGGLFLPKVTKIIKENNDEKNIRLENIFIKVGKIQILIYGIILIGFFILGQEFINNIWMKTYDFANSYIVALLLILPGFFTYTQQIGKTSLISLNKVKKIAIGEIIRTIIFLLLAFIFGQKKGAIGIGIAYFISTVFGIIIYMNFIYHKELKINIFNFYKIVYIKYLFPCILTILIGLFLNTIFSEETFLFFVIKALFLIITYIILILLFFLDYNDKQEVKNIILGFFNKRKLKANNN